MIKPAFIIFSPSRTGSTALYRALNLIPGTWVYYEPGFDDIEPSEDAVRERVTDLLSDHSGFNHVFDPAGFPFRPVDWTPIEEMERDAPLWLRLNSTILNYPGIRVVFLRRRNGFLRILSDQVRKFTNLGGTGGRPVSASEAALYRRAIGNVTIPPLDETLVNWYLVNLPRIQHELRAGITSNPVIDIWYEDFFGDEIGLPLRIERFRELVRFLEIPSPPHIFDSLELALDLRPGAKLNDSQIYRRIPNYQELAAQFAIPRYTGEDSGGADSPVAPSSPSLAAPSAPPVLTPKWRMRAARNTVAGLAVLPDDPGAVRVNIERVNPSVNYDVQASLQLGPVEMGQDYVLRFRARADRPRRIGIGVAQAHHPWEPLGYYENLQLSESWTEFRREFRASAADERARVLFDVGAAAIPVEIARVTFARARSPLLAPATVSR